MTVRRLAATLTATLLGLGAALAPNAALADDDDETDAEGCVLGMEESEFPTDGDERRVAWPQVDMDPDRVWPHTTGEGVKVAVIDSGVDADHPLLDGKVTGVKAYVDAKAGTREDDRDLSDAGAEDCVGHGTAVAGIIAADASEGDSGFYGLAPDAEILSIRVANTAPTDEAETTEDEEDDDPEFSEQDMGDAIRTAVDADADVINLSLKYNDDYQPIADAVAYAEEQGVVVVAAGGNEGEAGDQAEMAPYPASYATVVGVGAVDRTVTKVSSSQWGPWIDVVAPGAQLVTLERDGAFNPDFGGTSGATAYVSATVALLVELYRDADWTPADYRSQIFGTAAPTPGGTAGSPEYGNGMIDPYGAVTERLSSDEPVPPKGVEEPYMGPDYADRVAHSSLVNAWAVGWTLGGLATFFGGLYLVVSYRRGRTKGWRVKTVDKSKHLQPLDDGDPIPIYYGIKGLKR